jgi:ABC-type cobalamin/Fe3+-siderophores transport system ATPase subunit
VTLVLEAVDLAVGRGKTAVLSHVNLGVTAGERLALVGANGSGKTTLLRALAGLDPVLGGAIRWEGGALPSGQARVRMLGVLFQTEVASRFSVRELVTLGLGLDGPPSAPAKSRVQEMLERAELVPLAERSCASLSGGELQRAVLSRALVAEPRILLLDEPTLHLDPARHATLLGWLDRLRGVTAVVLATHDLALAATCDRVALLDGGLVSALGPADQVLSPESLLNTLGVIVRRLDDPDGGPPLFRVVALRDKGAAA